MKAMSRPIVRYSMLDSLRKIVDRSACLSALNYLKGQVLYRAGLRDHGSGATHYSSAVGQSVGYIRGVMSDYLQYSQTTESGLVGKRVLEIGPGDNLGVALSFLARGAAHVTCLDRFRPLTDERRNAAIYRELWHSFSDAERERLSTAARVAADGELTVDPSRLRCLYGQPIETWQVDEPFDLIVSRAVLEHVYDLERSWLAMTSALADDGQMWHKVDLRHHGFFGQFHPLYFLTISPKCWQWISSPDPTLNRRRLPDYTRLLKCTFREYDVFVTHVLDYPEIIPHRRELTDADFQPEDLQRVERLRTRMPEPFRAASAQELMVTGVFLIARGPLRGKT